MIVEINGLRFEFGHDEDYGRVIVTVSSAETDVEVREAHTDNFAESLTYTFVNEVEDEEDD